MTIFSFVAIKSLDQRHRTELPRSHRRFVANPIVVYSTTGARENKPVQGRYKEEREYSSIVITMPSKKNKQKQKTEVPLERRTILDGHCSMLAPCPVTNSGRSDGGWMDRIGITNSGLGYIFRMENALGPRDCFYSNDAYAKAGFCTMQLDLHPALEMIGGSSAPESLEKYLEDYLQDTENEYYRRGDFRKIDSVPRIIDDPSSIDSPASMIVQIPFEVSITPGPNIPPGLTATTYAALVHFCGKGNVLFKANNFERHSPPLDYQKVLASITYETDAGPYRQVEHVMATLATVARAQCLAGTIPDACLNCGIVSSNLDDGCLKTCGKCQVATYCGRECQAKDWKRHKTSGECRLQVD